MDDSEIELNYPPTLCLCTHLFRCSTQPMLFPLIVNGAVYCFGDNTFNQVGKKNTVDGPAKCSRPERIKFASSVKIKIVSCGAYHSAAVSGTV